MRTIKIIIFVVIAVALIWGGKVFNARLDEKAQQTAIAEQEKVKETLQKNMEKLIIKDTVVGTGPEVKNGDTVSVHYVGTFDNGQKFDSSRDRNQPLSFKLGAGGVIQGWDLGILGMNVGGTRELTIPPELGYGDQDYSGIPGNSTLHFTVELLAIQ